MNGHLHADHASRWVARFAALVGPGATVLDLACGGGRHTRLFAARGARVTAVDRDVEAIGRLGGMDWVTPICADVEGGPWPLPGVRFDAIVVTNYLHRPLFPMLIDSLTPGGVLIYETFMLGNERFGKPSNPDFLLRPGELLEAFDRLAILAFEQGETDEIKPAMVQRICAVNAPRPNCRIP